MEPNYRQSEILIKIPANEKRREKGEEVKNSHSAARYSFARACTCVTIADILGIPGRKTNIDGTRTFRGLLNALMTSIQPDTAGHAAGFPPISPAISGIHRTCLLCDHAEKVEKKKKKRSIRLQIYGFNKCTGQGKSVDRFGWRGLFHR